MPSIRPYDRQQEKSIARSLAGTLVDEESKSSAGDMEFDEPKSLSVFLKAAFMNYDEEDITVKDDKEIYGAKILLPGNDQTVHNFLQDYARTCLEDLK